MKKIPATENSLAIRTDFSDEAAWRAICEAITRPVGDFRAYVDFINDPQYDGLTVERLPTVLSEDCFRSFAFLIDRTALTHPDHPILVVDLYNAPGRVFRVIPSEMQSVENNLSIANMDFEEFADNVDDKGIFRGFPQA